MIDTEDGNFVLLVAGGGFVGVCLVVLALVLYAVAYSNEQECGERACERGTAKLLDHECVCVSEPE